MSLADAQRITAAPFMTGYSAGCMVTCEQFPERPGLAFRWTASVIGNEVVMDLAAQGVGAALKCISWPRSIELGNAATDLTVIPRMQGMLLPGNWPQAISAEDLVNSRAFYLPWWGQIHDGRGVQTILETTSDAGGRYVHPAGGPTSVEPVWFASLGQFGHLRTIRYVFDDAATYVTMAKRFRRFVREFADVRRNIKRRLGLLAPLTVLAAHALKQVSVLTQQAQSSAKPILRSFAHPPLPQQKRYVRLMQTSRRAVPAGRQAKRRRTLRSSKSTYINNAKSEKTVSITPTNASTRTIEQLQSA